MCLLWNLVSEGVIRYLTVGVYIEGFAGIRLEDVLVVTENGPELLSGERAKDWLHP